MSASTGKKALETHKRTEERRSNESLKHLAYDHVQLENTRKQRNHRESAY